MNKVLILAIATLGICIFAQIGFAMQMAVESSSGPIISVEPSYLKVSPGEEFTVNITVDPVGVEILGAQYELYFNNTILQATKQIKGQFLTQDGASSMVITNAINNTIGKAEYGEFRTVDYGVTLPGILATITFKAMDEQGTSNLNLSNEVLSDVLGESIPGVLVNNGTVEIEVYIFDTSSPENPYPCISGIHNGTIIPNQPIIVNRIFTYSCSGTGGHTEYVRIWGNGEDANATWSGYVDDWHNLTFNRTFTLEPGIEYNYTIRTGSYPQIIHIHALEYEYNATGGKIRCSEFTDANGKKYENWIPAIRLG